MHGGRGWNVGNMKYSQGVACTSYQSYTCKISNAYVWGKIECVYIGEGTGLCVCKILSKILLYCQAAAHLHGRLP